jgi:hypothetical protein
MKLYLSRHYLPPLNYPQTLTHLDQQSQHRRPRRQNEMCYYQ